MKIKNKTLLLVGIFSTLLAFVVWWQLRLPDAGTQPSYSYVTIKRGDITDVVSATGILNPINTVQVGSQVSGTIQQLFADFNEDVKQGQIVAKIDAAVFQAKLAEAKANLQSAKAGVDKASVTVKDAKRKLDRHQTLLDKKLVAENILDAARFEYDSALVEQQVKQAEVAKAEAVLEREEVNLAYTTIYAPIDGVIISRDVDVGQTVAASLQAPTLFTIANDLTRMQVEAEVDEAYIGQILEGQPVQFSVFAYPGRKFEGVVAQVRLKPIVDSGVVKYNSIIHVDNTDMALKPGMTATVTIQVAQQKDVLQVPGSALRFVPDWPEDRLSALRSQLKPGRRIVWIQDNDDLKPIIVTSGITGRSSVEIISDELDEGMAVAVPEKRKTEAKRSFGLSLF